MLPKRLCRDEPDAPSQSPGNRQPAPKQYRRPPLKKPTGNCLPQKPLPDQQVSAFYGYRDAARAFFLAEHCQWQPPPTSLLLPNLQTYIADRWYVHARLADVLE